jgi:hypothetical protein
MRALIVPLIAVLYVGCATKGMVPNDVFRFKSPQDQRDFERRGLAGDTEAAQRLSDYYCFVQHDYRRALYWARICASHGSTDCAKSAQTYREIIREQGL